MYCHLVFLIEGSKRAEAKKEDSKKVETKKAEAKKNAVKLQSSNCIKGCLLFDIKQRREKTGSVCYLSLPDNRFSAQVRTEK